MILPLLLLAAQITPVQPIVKGTALPPPGSEEAGVMTPVTGLLAGIAARDGQEMAKYLRPDGSATIAAEKPDGTRAVTHISAADLIARFAPGPEKFEERLTDPAIEIDGDIAQKLIGVGRPHARQIRFTIGQTRRRRGQIGLTVCSARNRLQRHFGPLRPQGHGY